MTTTKEKERDAGKSETRESAVRLLVAHVASTLLFHRLRLGMSHEEVAKIAEVSPTTVRDAERGYANTTLRTLGSILYALGLEVRDLSTVPLGSINSLFAGVRADD